MSRIQLYSGQSGLCQSRLGARLSSMPQNPALIPARSARNLSGERKGSGEF